MDLKDYNVGKFIDSTFSQLLHYFLPKKYQKEGSLASKPWMKKMKIASPLVALGVLIFMFFLWVAFVYKNPPGSHLVFLLGMIFLFLILVCFLGIGIAALIKRDGSIFYLYLLKVSIWAFCGSLLLFGVGALMSSKERSMNPEEEKANIEEEQRKTKEREARQKSYDELWEASGVSSSNSIGSIYKELRLTEEYKKVLAEEPLKQSDKSSLEDATTPYVSNTKKQLEENAKQIEQLQKSLAQEQEKTKSLESKLADKSLTSSKEAVQSNKPEAIKKPEYTPSPSFHARSPAEKWADEAVETKERELEKKKIKEQKLRREAMLKERLERLSSAAARKKYENAHPNGPEYDDTRYWSFTDEEITELEQELELEAVTKENSTLKKQREELVKSYEEAKIEIPKKITKLQKVFHKITFFEDQLQAFEPSFERLQEKQLKTPEEFEKEWSILQIWLEQQEKETFSSPDHFILVNELPNSKKIVFIENEEIDRKIKEVKAENVSLQKENAAREFAEKGRIGISSDLWKATHEASEKSRAIQRKLDRIIEKTSNPQEKKW